MFAGGRRRSSNIRVMQLFHELKQQFPTVPDHIVTACISEYANRNTPEGDTDRETFTFREVLEAAAALRVAENQELMGRSLTKPTNPTVTLSEPKLCQNSDNPILSDKSTVIQLNRYEMNEGDSDINRNVVKSSVFYSKETECTNVSENKSSPQRPNHLDIKTSDVSETAGFNKIQPSERCFDLQKLLNTDNLNVKPPRSPIVSKRFASTKNSPTKPEDTKSPLASPENSRKSVYQGSIDSGHYSASLHSPSGSNSLVGCASKKVESPTRRPETAETPTQTSDTLIGGVNLSLNVNCQMDVVQSPTIPKHSTVLQLTPQMPWCQESPSQRSYTSVNLTLRPPSSEPQPPIDITSQNSSLTYSTSSFDSQKGLQSRLQITVGPGGGSVSSIRTRPRSSYCVEEKKIEESVPVRAGSMPDLATDVTSPVISKQQARIERLRIELITEKGRLIAMQKEIVVLEAPNSITCKVDAEIEKQLQKEIRHLRGQCERLTYDVDRHSESRFPLGETSEEFYRNIYTGQRGPLTLGSSERVESRQTHRENLRQIPQMEIEDPKWNCHMCTFQNHPLLDKCEQCEMPRILHGTKTEPPHPCLPFGMVNPYDESGPYNPNQYFNNSNPISLNTTNSGSSLCDIYPQLRRRRQPFTCAD